MFEQHAEDVPAFHIGDAGDMGGVAAIHEQALTAGCWMRTDDRVSDRFVNLHTFVSKRSGP